MESSLGRLVTGVGGALLLAIGCGGNTEPMAGAAKGLGPADQGPPAVTPAAQGGSGGMATSSGSGGAGGGGGAPAAATCPASARVSCAGTMNGPWCVDRLVPSTDQTFPTFTGVWSSGADDAWATGLRLTAPGAQTSVGFIFHWDGCRWTQSALPSTEPALNAIWGAAPDDVWAVGEHGAALMWDGTYWSDVPVGADVRLSSVSGTAGDDVWASGGYHWNGSNWSLPAGGIPGGGVPLFGDVWAVAPNDVWSTLGFSTDVAHWDGVAWTSMTATGSPAFGLFAIWADASTGWTGGEGEQQAHLANGVWTQIENPGGSSEGIIDIMQSGDDVYAAGNSLLHGVGVGPLMRDTTAPGGIRFHSVWMTPSQVWAAGGTAVIHRAR